jgi:hypothetical protein
MSVFTYNSVTLPYCYTTQLSQEAVGDESDTDFTYTKFTIGLEAIISASYLAVIYQSLVQNGVPVTSNPADIMNVVRSLLLQRRKPLSFKVNGVEQIPQIVSGNKGAVDARNGPIPRECRILQLNSTTFIISYRIEAHYWENFTIGNGSPVVRANNAGNPVISNRWEEQVSIDNCNRTTRTRRGKYVIRSDNVQGFLADQIRSGMAVLGIPSGFLRKQANYTIDPTGLGIQYEIVDEEQFKMPPRPAFEADGRYVETVSNMTYRTGMVMVHLKADNRTNQVDIAKTAIIVGCQRLRNGGAIGPGVGTKISMILEASIDIPMYRNEATFKCVVLFSPTDVGFNNIKAFTQVSTLTPQSDLVSYTPAYLDRGSASFLLQAANYYDPSIPSNALAPGVKQPINQNSLTTSSKYQLIAGVGVGAAGQKGG